MRSEFRCAKLAWFRAEFGAMSVKERMQALGGHARSSRQPPLKERKSAKADESAAKQEVIDEEILENGAAHDSAAAVIVDDAAPQTDVHENGNGAVAEITPDEEAAVLATVAAVLAKLELQPATDDNVTRPEAGREDEDLSAAKHAIIHEWENWSALHSDELYDPNVAEYFFRHLEAKKPRLLNSGFKDIQSILSRGYSLRMSNEDGANHQAQSLVAPAQGNRTGRDASGGPSGYQPKLWN